MYAQDIFILRPVLFGIDGLKDAIFSDLNLQYSPQYYHFIANSSNIVFDSISISGQSHSNNSAKNTDGWDLYRSSDITIMNSVIDNGDGEYNREQFKHQLEAVAYHLDLRLHLV